jgi:hypothetical protein
MDFYPFCYYFLPLPQAGPELLALHYVASCRLLDF